MAAEARGVGRFFTAGTGSASSGAGSASQGQVLLLQEQVLLLQRHQLRRDQLLRDQHDQHHLQNNTEGKSHQYIYSQ